MYTHAASPLRKAVSANYLRQGAAGAKESGVERVRREASPLKRMSMPGEAQQSGEARGALNHRLKALRGEGGARRESGRF